jgi:hypothetical protein
MEPIKLIRIHTRKFDDGYDPTEELVTKYELSYDGQEKPDGLTIIDSSQYSQENADENWEEVYKWIQEDEERIRDYERGIWWSFGIEAIATLHFPMEITEAKIIQRIKSPGTCGAESDYSDFEIEDIEEREIIYLLDMLRSMGVEVQDNFLCELSISNEKVSVDYLMVKCFGE